MPWLILQPVSGHHQSPLFRLIRYSRHTTRSEHQSAHTVMLMPVLAIQLLQALTILTIDPIVDMFRYQVLI